MSACERGPPSERAKATADLLAASELLVRHIKRERIPAVVRRAIPVLGGLSLLDLLKQGRSDELLKACRSMFDFRHTFQDLANLTAFSEAQFVWELGGRHNHIVETSSGLRLPFSDFFYAQLSLDYDRFESIEAPGSADNDESEWNFRMGIQWD